MDIGAQEQWDNDVGWAIDIAAASVPHEAGEWGDLTGEPLDPDKVANARKLEIEYFRQMDTRKQVPMQEVEAGKHLGLRHAVGRCHESRRNTELAVGREGKQHVHRPGALCRDTSDRVAQVCSPESKQLRMGRTMGVACAYFYTDASAARIFVNLPMEPGEEQISSKKPCAGQATPHRVGSANSRRTSGSLVS